MPGTVRSYIYISDTKVDILAQQAPRRQQRRLRERKRYLEGRLEARFPFVSTAAGYSEESDIASTRIARLDTAVGLLRRKGLLGDAGSPCQWFEFTAPARWEILSFPVDRRRDGPLGVLFLARHQGLTIGLHGSAHHLIGHSSLPQRNGVSKSGYMWGMWEVLENGGHLRALDVLARLNLRTRRTYPLPSPYERVARLSHDMRAYQTVTAIAERFGEHEDEWTSSGRIILGSPLYVAGAPSS